MVIAVFIDGRNIASWNGTMIDCLFVYFRGALSALVIWSCSMEKKVTAVKLAPTVVLHDL